MRISLIPNVCSGLFLSFLLFVAGCSNASSQSLPLLTATAFPSAVAVGGASVVKAMTHFGGGPKQDVTSGASFVLSDPALATMSIGAITAKPAEMLIAQAGATAIAPAGGSPTAATAMPRSASTTRTVSPKETASAQPAINAAVAAKAWALAAPTGCGGPTINLNSGMSQSTLQSSITNAPTCSLILFAPGTYTITSSLAVPCNSLTITGPNIFPNAAILNATFSTSAIFTLPGNCTTGLNLEFLAGYNTGLLYVYPGNAANISILHNTTGNLPSSQNASGPYAFSGSIYFNGTIDTTMTNVTIEYNLFGDANSCKAVFSVGIDYGGNCAGFMVHQGRITNLIVKYNKFFHLEEGLHILPVSSYQPGQREATADNLDIEYNYFLNIHRIEVEDQIGTINHPQIVSNNIYQDQSYAYYGSLGASLPCCQNGGNYGKAGLDPGMQANNNVYINSVHDGLGCTFCGNSGNSGPAFTVEFWGTGSQGNNNLIQGLFGNGFEWGYGGGDWQIEYNQICGPNMARQYANIANYISNEEQQNNPPTQVGNVTSASCSAYASVAPTISPASGTYVAGQTITLSDTGVTSGPGPHGNTSVYYTLDGTNPVPGSGTTIRYAHPFVLAAAATVKAVGLYGSGGDNPQTWPTVYPAGYGYVPSAVVTATYTDAGTTPPAPPAPPTPPTPPTPPAPPTTPTPNPPAFPAPVGCGGPTINLNSGMSQSTLQSSISNAPTCSLILFAPGTYKITSSLSVPCSNLTITGPNIFPNTAILNATFNTSAIFNLSGNCTTGFNLEYLAGYNTSLFYMSPGNAANISILHNTTGNLPSSQNPAGPYAFSGSIYFNGTIDTSLSNVTIEYNSFGDANSCTAVFSIGVDYGGNCAGFMVHQGKITNLIVKYNKFFHLEEGLHILAVSSYQPGQREATADNLDIEYNYFLNIHRIEVEDQIGTINHPHIVSNNIYQDQSYAYYGSLGASLPCCQNGGVYGKAGLDPGVQANNNVYINSIHDGLGCLFCGSSSNPGPAFTVEFWGNGSQGNNNLLQGNFGNGFEWGYGSGDWQIEYNQICGPNMARQYANIANYISNEESTNNPPTQVGNVTSASCSAYTSVAPTINPASGTFVAGQTITLSDTGVTSGAGPHGNTSVYYTTDGTNPVPGSGTTQLYTGPFTMAAAGVIKAVGLYGTGGTNPQTWPTVYPAGYGYVPSAVVTATYNNASVAPAARARVNAAVVRVGTSTGATTPAARILAIAITPNQPSVAIGRTTQLKATATYDDGSVKDVTTEFQWQSSNARTITASASGLLTGLASGPATISGGYKGLKASAQATSSIGDVDWSGPTVITSGGTYSGNWQSTDAQTAAVTIATTEPVIIENAHIRSVGSLIKTGIAGTNLTVRNSLGVALNANMKGQPNGTFLEVTSPVRLDVENNYIENARGGVIVHGYSGKRDADQTITIRSNRARNLNGMLSNGSQGYLPASGRGQSQARFIQFDSVQAVPGIDVGWNEVVNYPGLSLVGDNIEIYRSGGTANRPLEVHDSYIQGAYPYDAAKDVYFGGGIKTNSKAGDDTEEVPAFNSIHDNQVVGTAHYGIQFSAGHDNVASNNRVISSGLLENGTRIVSQHVGMANAEAGGATVSNGAMYNNTMRDNTIGWMCWQASCAQEGYRRDKYFPVSPSDYDANAALANGQVTLETENNEYLVWMNKVVSAGVAVGPEF